MIASECLLSGKTWKNKSQKYFFLPEKSQGILEKFYLEKFLSKISSEEFFCYFDIGQTNSSFLFNIFKI